LIGYDENEMLSFSSSFWDENKLIETYNTLLEYCQKQIQSDTTTIQNELN
jgi:hypothetical protein